MVKEKAWYVAHLRPNGLSRAIVNLERQGFTTFAPYRKTRRLRQGAWQAARAPLFPGYVFVRFAVADGHWRAINNTFGVARLLAENARVPMALPADLIAGLRARCDGGGELLPSDQLMVGDEIRILSGPFAEYVTRIEEVESDERVRVMLQVLGRDVPASIETRIIARKR